MALETPSSRFWTTDARNYLESLDLFSYDEPLEGRNIRLVQLLDAEAGRPIQCELVCRSLDSDVKYQALSYVWGDSRERRTISCDGRRLDLTTSLYDALVQLCANNKIRDNSFVWIDAICIDQGNVIEKTAQIKMMREIYSHASYTIIWLGKRFGPTGEDVIKGIQLLYKIGTAINGRVESEECMEIANRIINGEDGNAEQNSLEIWKVFSRGWFGRIWVVQEFVVSSSSLAYIGPIVVSSGIIFQVANILRFSRDWVISPYSIQLIRLNPTVLNAGLFWNLKNQCQSPKRMRLHELVVKTTTFDATVPVDAIFALVGLACDVDPEFIDYSLDIRTVHINIAKNALMSFIRGDISAFDFLTYVRGDSDQDETMNFKLPSWAPNLRRFDRFNLHKSLTFRPLIDDFPSAARLPLPGTFTAVFGSDESLQVRVVFLDKVATVVDPHVYTAPTTTKTNLGEGQAYIDGLKIWETKSHSLAKSLGQYPTNEDISVVYSKTLSFDYLARSNPMFDIQQRAIIYVKDYELFKESLEIVCTLQSSQEIRPKPQNPDDIVLDSPTKHVYLSSRGFSDTFDFYSVGRCFSTTRNGYMGWVPEGAQAGDDICVFPWSLTPFIVRQRDMGYHLVGACFIEALMRIDSFRILHQTAREIKIY